MQLTLKDGSCDPQTAVIGQELRDFPLVGDVARGQTSGGGNYYHLTRKQSMRTDG